jgi:hypothetical protein
MAILQASRDGCIIITTKMTSSVVDPDQVGFGIVFCLIPHFLAKSTFAKSYFSFL